MAALIDAKVGRAITPGLAARLLARTAGNPFFAGELARDLDGRGALVEGQELDSAPVPDAVADLVEERLARLDPGTERFLAAVAAIGPSAPVALAAGAVGLSREEAERAVQEALSERLVDDVVALRPTIAFPHALVREALIAGMGRIRECEEAVTRGAEIAQRLATPRFTWEVDLYRSMRLIDRGDRDAADVLLRRAGSVVRRLRPDMHIVVELVGLIMSEWYYDGDTAASHIVYETIDEVAPRAVISAAASISNAASGNFETARRQMWRLLGDDDLEPLRRPDGHMPAAICLLAFTATMIGDREAGARLRPLFEPLRNTLIQTPPSIDFGLQPEWQIGRLELLAEEPDAAVVELRHAVERADEMEIAWARPCIRVDLATALHRRGRADDAAEAESVLVKAEELAERYGVRWASARS
jgi:hypothetical protein